MRLYKIQNKHLFKGDNPNGYHTYVTYYDYTHKQWRAVRLTHLYEEKKRRQIEKGYLKVEKFKQFKYPSGVYIFSENKDINNKPLYFGKNTYHQYVGDIPAKQAQRIKRYIKGVNK